MWLERFLIIVPSLARKQALSFNWSTYHPSVIEILIIIGGVSFVAMLVLLFAKVFPLIPVFDIKEGMVIRDEIKIGRRIVPATIHE